MLLNSFPRVAVLPRMLALCLAVALAPSVWPPLAVPAHAAEQLYTCGMHPQIIKKEPGNCPICGMKLTPIRSGASATAAAGPDIELDAATVQRMNLKTDLVRTGPVRRELRTVGNVTFNEETLRDVTTKYEGWIEKLHVNTTWAPVRAGEPLFDIYSPDLYNAELNFVVALRGEKDPDGPLTRAATERLKLFDVPDDIIEALRKTGQVERLYTFRAPVDGVVIEKMGVVGQMMRPGERIYRLADLGTVWVEAQIYEQDVPFVHEGQAVEIRTSYGDGHAIAGEIQRLLPRVEEQTRTATARIVVRNEDGRLRPGMFVDVAMASTIADEAVLVPDMAVLRSGETNTVFIAERGGHFTAREVTLGARSSGDLYQVLGGLKAGERVVVSGQFMLDSESQRREAIQKMMRNDSPDHSHAAAEASDPAADTRATGSASHSGGPADEALRALALTLADAAAALGSDDLAGYAKLLPELRRGLDAVVAAGDGGAAALRAFQGTLTDASDLRTARREFEPLSTTVADLVRARGIFRTSELHIFECPMAPVGGTGRWLQRTGETLNPFFGSSMPDCGEEIAAPEKAAQPSAQVLPAGHPPVDVASRVLVALASRRTVSHQATSSSGCGGCGMSAAEMEAGEPCAHDAP